MKAATTFAVDDETVEAIREALQVGVTAQQSGDLRRAEFIYRQVLDAIPELPEALVLLGTLAAHNRHFEDAEKLARRALKVRPGEVSYLELQGRALRGLGRNEEALSCYERAAGFATDRPEVHIGMGLALKALDRNAEAASAFSRAIEIDPKRADAFVNLANVLRKTSDWSVAIARYEHAIALDSSLPQAHNNLGAVLVDLNQDERAAECFSKALDLNPTYAEPMYNLGRIALLKEDKVTAQQWMKRAVDADPNYADPWIILGVIHGNLNEMAEMTDCFNEALRRRPNDSEIFWSFGSILKGHGYLAQAEMVFQQALSLNPDSVAALSDLALTLSMMGRAAEALKVYDRLFAINSKLLDAKLNFGNLLVSLGRVAEGLELHRGLALVTEGPPANFLLDLCYVCEDGIELDRAHREWPSKLRASMPVVVPHNNSSVPGRQLKIAFLSGDFRTHSVAYFIESVFAHLDRSQFEIRAYATTWSSDATTERLKSYAAGWRCVAGVPDKEVVNIIRTDGIDVLIDLVGHTASSRWGVLAQKPAPVQVSYLGYPTLTGIPTIDYRLTDWEVDPENGVDTDGERPIRLPHSYFCFRPSGDAPEVGPLPMEQNGFITFGSFNNLAKLSPAVIDLWGRLLAKDDSARLLLKAKGLNDPDTQDRLRMALCAAGGTPERITLLPWEASQVSHLDIYNRIDIALDSFPYNGATTTCEALWMGVPVISLAGATHPSRMGRSLLRAAGLTELLVDSTARYFELARELAGDPSRLASLRATLRTRLRESALLDGPGFARDFGLAMRAMWMRWCETARD
jgi:predicted O-linked N-acetylglucosamine transferase (SPINDLY family)